MTFKDVREEWWSGKTFDLREISIFKLSEIIRCHISPYFDDMAIDKITDVDVNKYIANELSHGNRLNHGPLCQNTIKKALNIINNVFKYAVLKHYIRDNPMDLVPRLKHVQSKPFNIFYPDEIERLISVARPKWLGDMIILAYHTGMSKEEIYGLQWSDIDFEQNFLNINKTIVAISPKRYFINEPKTKTSRRLIMMDDVTIEMLRRRQLNRTSDTWVFANKFGTEINPWYNVKYFRNSCAKVGIENKRFHDLRHTHITELVSAEKSIPVIQQRAGHSDIKMTMHYTHISPKMQQSIIDFLNNRNRQKKEKRNE